MHRTTFNFIMFSTGFLRLNKDESMIVTHSRSTLRFRHVTTHIVGYLQYIIRVNKGTLKGENVSRDTSEDRNVVTHAHAHARTHRHTRTHKQMPQATEACLENDSARRVQSIG